MNALGSVATGTVVIRPEKRSGQTHRDLLAVARWPTAVLAAEVSKDNNRCGPVLQLPMSLQGWMRPVTVHA